MSLFRRNVIGICFLSFFTLLQSCNEDKETPGPVSFGEKIGIPGGTATFWANSSTQPLGVIEIFVDGEKIGSITNSTSRPECGLVSSNVISFNGPTGVYSWSATSSQNSSWSASGTFSTSIESCDIIEIEFAVGEVTFWTDLSTESLGSIEVFIENQSVGTISSREFEPNCGTNSNAITFQGSPGTYRWEAFSSLGGISWPDRSFTITEDFCDDLQLVCVSCVEPEFEGNYMAVSDASTPDTCAPSPTLNGYTANVTITDLGNCEYQISDFFGGVYKEWYGACYNYTIDTPATFMFCNTDDVISMASFINGFGFQTQVNSISYETNPETITLIWEDLVFQNSGTTVFTKQ